MSASLRRLRPGCRRWTVGEIRFLVAACREAAAKHLRRKAVVSRLAAIFDRSRNSVAAKMEHCGAWVIGKGWGETFTEAKRR